MKNASTGYLVVNVSDVKAVVDAIYAEHGDVLAINAPSTKPGEPPTTREVWFFARATEQEIAEKARLTVFVG